MSDLLNKLKGVPGWLEKFHNDGLKTGVLKLGEVTGWRKRPDGKYGPANFERALVLDRLVNIMKPSTALEVGTGRGLGCLTMSRSAAEYGIDLKIATLDILSPDARQDWPIRVDGEDKVIIANRREVWSSRVDPSLQERVEQITGRTTELLPKLVEEGRRFDLIFIDAGHDAFSVVFDISCAMRLLNDGGAILLDDFAPLEEYGIGACMAAQHLKDWFTLVEIFKTDGLVYHYEDGQPAFSRGMVLVSGLKKRPPEKASLWRALWWRMVSWALYKSARPGKFPI
ncbi:MAG: class I SAM-dependent methyltransferase [Nitrospinae bacterium]|nr:class I SAM-dependent methyltransferase [Nitrospinota bacterium]